ncbi:peptidoglycan DD-metalloendopeptidase family protein [Vallitalea guaymasensis]|uniref:peptidoglycan DD-metalloendopeptidase family protein n=1 Tax=Vallitalea guaymasensis TaxID=1185412 RepID=UPI002353ED1D|nr:M23 family metallopeptidase [Vallitalea guaymasensis]
MNGASKYKENILFKYKKEIILIFCSLFIFFTIGNVFISSKIETKATATANSYNVVYDGNSMGIVYDKSVADRVYSIAKAEMKDANGEHMKVNKELKYYLEYADDKQITDEDTLLNNLRTALTNDKESFQVKGYILKIGDDFQVALKDEDDVKEVLKRAQSMYINEADNYDIDLVRVPYTTSVRMPVITKNNNYNEIGTAERIFKTTTNISEENESDKKDAEIPIETVGVSFAEEVQIVKGFVDRADIANVADATELITKENEEEKVYAVAKGDTLSEIAQKNDMKLSELMKLNPGLEKQKYINIGQEITVTVPEPELSVACDEKIIYTKPIQYTVEKVENKNKYNGTTTVLEYGVEGEMQVTAVVTKVNGYEQSRTVIDEKVIKEPKAKVIEVGIKPFPSKGSTGNFIYPVVGSIITSPFGYRRGGFHHGLDLGGLPVGTSIRASDGGTVTFAGWKSSTYGYTVDIDHGNGVMTRYAHCSKVVVKKGQKVSQYQEIAKLGSTGNSTGPHVHFEIRFNNVAANPKKYLD